MNAITEHNVKPTAELVLRLARYFHFNPVHQEEFYMGSSSSILYQFITATLDAPLTNRAHYYRTPKYYVYYCMQCGTHGKSDTPNRHFFSSECSNCHQCEEEGGVRDVTFSIDSSKYYNPLVEAFDTLDVTTRKEIIKYIFDTGTHPIYNSPHSERG